ncbi:MAG: TetR/AcrR family transcriptional regulator [Eggerthella lenta]
MPAIFTEADREELRRRMFDAGWDLIVEKGVRSLRVEDVASRVGIAKGTFYSFFPSKEEFAYSIVKANRRAVMDLFEELCEQGGPPRRDAMRMWPRSLWYSDRTPTATPPPRTSPTSRRWPTTQLRSRSIASRWAGSWSASRACVDADWRVVANLQKGIAHAARPGLMHAEPRRRRRRRHRSHLRRAVRPEGLPPAAALHGAAGVNVAAGAKAEVAPKRSTKAAANLLGLR